MSVCRLEKPNKDSYQLIKYVDIKNYESPRIIQIECLNLFVADINKQLDKIIKQQSEYDKSHCTSILEILTDDDVRMYFDIENIPKNDYSLIDEIIDKIYKLTGLDKYDPKYKYALTFNPNSHHEGLSYHLFLPVRTTKSDIYNFIKLFNYLTNYKYINMIDYRVYGRNRLFRTVGCCCPGQLKKKQERRFDDYHRLFEGELCDTIIQNYKNLDLVFSCPYDKDISHEFDEKVHRAESNFSEGQPRKYQHYKKPNTFNKSNNSLIEKPKVFDKSNNSLIERIDKLTNKLDTEIFKNANQTKQTINLENQLRNMNRTIFLIIIAVVIFMIMNFFK